MVDIWIIAATSGTLDRAGRNPDGVLPASGDTEQERHSVEFLCLMFSAPGLLDPIPVRGLVCFRLQAAVTSGSIACPCDYCFPGFTGCHRYGGKMFSLFIMYLYLCLLWDWVCLFFPLCFPFFSIHVFCFLKDGALLYSFIHSFYLLYILLHFYNCLQWIGQLFKVKSTSGAQKPMLGHDKESDLKFSR
jgi:hypothetical protein